MINPDVYAGIRAAINGKGIAKVAFTPLTPEAQAAAQQPQDPAMAAAPQDPAMGAMPQDPAAAAGAMPPPQAPAPMDPSQMGTPAPQPQDPAAAQAPQGTPVVVTLEDLQAMFGQKDQEMKAMMDGIGQALAALNEQLQALGQMGQMPAAQVGGDAGPGIPQPSEPPMLDAMAQGMAAPQSMSPGPQEAQQKIANINKQSTVLQDTVARLLKYR